MKNVAWLKWGGTGFVLSGILLTNLNLYPLNILVHGTGSLGWMLAGIITKDRALTVNCGMQMPLFAIGYAKMGGLI